MNYNIQNNTEETRKYNGVFASVKRLLALMGEEKKNLYIAIVFILINATLNLIAPYIIGNTVDTYVITKQYHGVITWSLVLLGIFLFALVSSYLQTMLVGGVGQRMLFNLRNSIFNKLQELPLDFFNQNKSGDLISRVNNDTEKINQFFSQYLVQFMSSIFTMIGAGIFLVSIDVQLGLATLAPALVLFIFTKIISPWVKQKNAKNLKSTGNLSAEIQESLSNFKVIITSNRRDYFKQRFEEVNKEAYDTAIKSGIANNIFTPVYGLLSNIGILIVLSLGIYFISQDRFTIGLLISFLAYTTHFYNPLRQIASLWANFQIALAGWDRISQILQLENNMPIETETQKSESTSLLSFKNVWFSYSNGKEVLEDVSFDLEKGKIYAFVGPTGGGKTTIASLIARLYDTTNGSVSLNGINIRSISTDIRSQRIGFILQEPFLFTGSVRENILYGNPSLHNLTNSKLLAILEENGLEKLLDKFNGGLDAIVSTSGESISLGQKQLIAFMRAILRKPDLLILDEATANIDTLTEQLLEEILQKLPSTTTVVIIAHRLNTIERADEIFFVNSCTVTKAGSLDDAVTLLLNHKRES